MSPAISAECNQFPEVYNATGILMSVIMFWCLTDANTIAETRLGLLYMETDYVINKTDYILKKTDYVIKRQLRQGCIDPAI